MSRTLGLCWKAIRPGERCWRVLGWLGVALAVLVLLVGFVLLAVGCTKTDQLKALTVATNSVSAKVPTLRELRDAEELKCLDGEPNFATARLCVQQSRAKWGLVWAAGDALVAIDTAAINGGAVDWAAAARDYCVVAAVAPGLPQLPPILGVCGK